MLISGLALWCFAHTLRRLFPALRDRLTEAVGLGPSKGIIALILVLSVLLMVIGYRNADDVPLWTTGPLAHGLAVMAMLPAIALFGLGSSQSRLRGTLRHPMLTGMLVWSLAHLLVNGDLASLVLFGTLALWSLAQMRLINQSSGPWEKPSPGTARGDVQLLVISLVLYAIIGFVHGLVGPSPFAV